MASRASIGGHPIHPMLIPFPIGLLVFSLIADLIYLWRGNPAWENYIAFYTLLGGKWIVSMPMLPFILSLVGVVGLSMAGYLGGELVFRHGVAVDVPASAQ